MAEDLRLLVGVNISPSIDRIKTDLQTVQRSINKDSPLKLTLSADEKQSVGRLTADLKKMKPQLDNVLKVSIGADSLRGAVPGSKTKQSWTKSSGNKELTEEQKQVQKVNQEYSQLMSTLKLINQIDLKIAKLDISKDTAQITELNHQLEIAKDQYSALYSGVMEDPVAKQVLSQKQLVSFKELEVKGVNDVNVALAKQKDVVEHIKKTKGESSDILQRKEEVSVRNLTKEYQIMLATLERMPLTWSKMTGDEGMMARRSGLMRDIDEILSSGDLNKMKDWSQSYRKDIRQLSLDLDIAGLKQKSFGDRVAETGQRLSSYLVSFFGYQMILGNITKALDAVKQIDASLVELQKVSDLSGAALERFTDRAFEAGDAIGRTGKDVLDATTNFKRAGFEIEESFNMARAALIMVNVAEGINSVDEAASSLIAVLRGFKISETDIMSVVDKINEVSQTSPVGFSDLTEGLKRVSGTLAQTGTDLSETIGLLTGGFASLRNMETASAGLLMISQRLRGIGEDGEAIEGLAPKLQEDFKRIADIDISKGNGELRSTYEILSDMARIMPTLTEQEQQYLGELAAGNNRVRVLNAILQNWTDVEGAVESATNSLGSAEKENTKHLNSIEGKTQKLTSSFQEMSHTLIDNSFVKFGLDAATAITKVLTLFDSVVGKVVALTVAMASLSAIMKTATIANFLDGFTGFFKSIGNIPAKFNEIGTAIQSMNKQAGNVKEVSKLLLSLGKDNLSQINKSFSEIGKSEGLKELYSAASGLETAMTGLTAKQKIAIITSQDFNKSQMMAALTCAGLTEEEIAQALATSTVSVAQRTATATTWSWKAAWDGLKVSIATNPIGFALTAITMAASIAIPVFQKLFKSQQELIEKSNELTSAWKDEQVVLKQMKDTIESIAPEYSKLSKGIGDQGKNISLSTEEYKRYNDIVNQIADMFPEMVRGYTDEGNAILFHKGNVEALTQAYEDNKRAAQDAIILGASDVFKGFKAATQGRRPIGDDDSKETILSFGKDIESQLEYIRSLGDEDLKLKTIDDFRDYIRDLEDANVRNVLRNAGIDFTSFTNRADVLLENFSKISAGNRKLVSELNSETAKIKPILSAYLETDTNFQRLSEEAQNSIKTIIGSFDYSFFSQFKTEIDMKSWVDENLVQPLSDPSMSQQMQEALESLFNLEDMGDSAQDEVDKARDIISSLPEEIQRILTPKILIKLGIGLNIEDTKAQLAKAKPELADMVNNLVESLPKTDLNLLINMEDDDFKKYISSSTSNMEDLVNAINGYKTSIAEAARQKSLASVLSGLQSKSSLLTKALKEQNETGKLSYDTFNEMSNAGEDFAKLISVDLDKGYQLLIDDTIKFNNEQAELAIQTAIANGALEDEVESIKSLLLFIPKLTDSLKELTTFQKSMEDIQKDIKAGGGLTLESYEKLLELLPEISEEISRYLLGLSSEKELQEAISKASKQKLVDIENEAKYRAFIQIQQVKDTAEAYGLDAKNFKSVEDFKNSILNSSRFEQLGITQDTVKKKAEEYQIDLKNFKEVERLKIKMANQAIVERQNKLKADLASKTDPAEKFALSGLVNTLVADLEKQKIDDSFLDLIYRSLDMDLDKSLSGASGKSPSSPADQFPDILKLDIDRYIELDAQINRTKNSIDLLNLAEEDYSHNAIKYGADHIDNLRTQANLQRGLAESYAALGEEQKRERQDLRGFLEGQGFSFEGGFDTENMSTNYSNRLSSMYDQYNAMAYGTDAAKDARARFKQTIDDIENAYKRIVDLNNTIYNTDKDRISAAKEVGKIYFEIFDVYTQIFDQEKAVRERALVLLEHQFDVAEKNVDYSGMAKNLEQQRIQQQSVADEAHREAERLRAEAITTFGSVADAPEETKQAIQKMVDIWWDAYGSIQEINSKIVQSTLGIYDDFIKYADDFELWNNLDVTRLDYLKKKLDEIEDLRKRGLITTQEYNDIYEASALEIYKEQKSALEKIIDLTGQLIKQEAKDKVDALNEQIRKYKEIISLKKQSLQDAKDENNYQKELAKKIAEMAKLQGKIDQLSRDDSREATAERKALEEQLAKLSEETADFQAQYSLDKQLESLDKEEEAFEKTKQEEIKVIEETVNTTAKIYALAIKRIDENWDTLYADLIEWNNIYGDGIAGKDSIASAWDTAAVSVKKYGDVLKSLESIKTENAATQSSGTSTNSTSDADNIALVKTKVSEMRANGIAWHDSSESDRKDLEKKNEILADEIGKLLKTKIIRDNGTWYIGSVGGDRLFDKYHKGGIAGNNPTLKQNEVMAILEKGEPVLDKKKERGLYKVIDFVSDLSKKLQSSMDIANPLSTLSDSKLKSFMDSVRPTITNNSSHSLLPSIVVNIKHNGPMTDNDAERYGNIIGDVGLQRIKDALTKSGID